MEIIITPDLWKIAKSKPTKENKRILELLNLDHFVVLQEDDVFWTESGYRGVTPQYFIDWITENTGLTYIP